MGQAPHKYQTHPPAPAVDERLLLLSSRSKISSQPPLAVAAAAAAPLPHAPVGQVQHALLNALDEGVRPFVTKRQQLRLAPQQALDLRQVRLRAAREGPLQIGIYIWSLWGSAGVCSCTVA